MINEFCASFSWFNVNCLKWWISQASFESIYQKEGWQLQLQNYSWRIIWQGEGFSKDLWHSTRRQWNVTFALLGEFGSPRLTINIIGFTSNVSSLLTHTGGQSERFLHFRISTLALLIFLGLILIHYSLNIVSPIAQSPKSYQKVFGKQEKNTYFSKYIGIIYETSQFGLDLGN